PTSGQIDVQGKIRQGKIRRIGRDFILAEARFRNTALGRRLTSIAGSDLHYLRDRAACVGKISFLQRRMPLETSGWFRQALAPPEGAQAAALLAERPFRDRSHCKALKDWESLQPKSLL